MAVPTETELKLKLTPAALAKLRESETLRRAALGAETRERVVTTYWDTAERSFARRGLTLRVRVQGDKRTQTVKAPGSAGLAMTRSEWEWPIDGDVPDLALAADTPAAAFAGARLEPTLITDVMRTRRMLSVEGARIEADLDEGEIRALGRTTPLCELELELREGAPGALYRLALALHAEAPFALETQSKAARGQQLAQGGKPAPLRAEPLVLAPGLAGVQAFRRIVAEALGHMLGNVAAAREGEAEGVHQLRVGLRRLRSALSLFAPLLSEAAVAPFERELRTLGRVVGQARDWGVFCDEALPRAFARLDAPDWGGLAALAAGRRRDAAVAAVAEAVGSPEFAALTLALAAWAEEAARQPRWVGESSLDKPIERLAPELIAGLVAKARKRARDARGGDLAALHGLRKSLKRLRYGLEFLDSVSPAPTKALKRLKKLLDKLGRLNDTAAAATMAEALGAAQVELAPVAAAFALRREEAKRSGLSRAAREALRGL